MKGYFLTKEEYSFLESFSSFIVPSGENIKEEPGAKEVGTVNYIDSTLFDMPKEVQDHFRKSIQIVQDSAKKQFEKDFVLLMDSEKEALLKELHLDHSTRDVIFELRSLALEGFYSDYHDPAYNGKTAWEILGFGGKRISDLKKDWSFLKIWRDSEKK